MSMCGKEEQILGMAKDGKDDLCAYFELLWSPFAKVTTRKRSSIYICGCFPNWNNAFLAYATEVGRIEGLY